MIVKNYPEGHEAAAVMPLLDLAQRQHGTSYIYIIIVVLCKIGLNLMIDILVKDEHILNSPEPEAIVTGLWPSSVYILLGIF